MNDVAEWSCDVFCSLNGDGVYADGGGDGDRAGDDWSVGDGCGDDVDCCGVGLRVVE